MCSCSCPVLLLVHGGTHTQRFIAAACVCLAGNKSSKPSSATTQLKAGSLPGLNNLAAPKVSGEPQTASDASKPQAGASGAAAASKEMDSLPLQILWRKVVKQLSSLPLAIGTMALITLLSGLGTVIPQNKVHQRQHRMCGLHAAGSMRSSRPCMHMG